MHDDPSPEGVGPYRRARPRGDAPTPRPRFDVDRGLLRAASLGVATAAMIAFIYAMEWLRPGTHYDFSSTVVCAWSVCALVGYRLFDARSPARVSVVATLLEVLVVGWPVPLFILGFPFDGSLFALLLPPIALALWSFAPLVFGVLEWAFDGRSHRARSWAVTAIALFAVVAVVLGALFGPSRPGTEPHATLPVVDRVTLAAVGPSTLSEGRPTAHVDGYDGLYVVRVCGELPGCELLLRRTPEVDVASLVSAGWPWVPRLDPVEVSRTADHRWVQLRSLDQSPWAPSAWIFDARTMRLASLDDWRRTQWPGVHGDWFVMALLGLVVTAARNAARGPKTLRGLLGLDGSMGHDGALFAVTVIGFTATPLIIELTLGLAGAR